MNRSIIHLDLDSFFVAVECLKNSKLKGRPVIVGGSGDRGVVAACSYEARKYGVHSAMAGRIAKQLCPEAIFIRGDFDSYSQYSEAVTDIMLAESPLLEKASIDEFYVDMTGMERFIGCYKWAGNIKKRILKEVGLQITYGLSANKTVSKVAVGEAKPNGQIYVPYGQEKPFLYPLPVGKMPMVGKQTAHLLKTMGVYTVGTLGSLPLRMIEGVFGQNGRSIWEKANGLDNSLVVPYSAQKSMSKESTYNQDTIDVCFLKAELTQMVMELASDLRGLGQMTGCLTIKIRYANFDTHTRQVQIPYTAADHLLIQYAHELFEKLYTRRMLIRLVGVKLSKLVTGANQLMLFDKSAKLEPLYQAIDFLKKRYGKTTVQRAVAVGNKAA